MNIAVGGDIGFGVWVMSAIAKFLIGLVVLLVLGALGIYYDMIPAGSAHRVEAKLLASSRQALRNADIYAVEIIRMDGQKAVLAGHVNSQQQLDDIKKIIRRANWSGGLVLGGITRVDSTMVTIASHRTSGRLPLASPYEWSARWESDAGALVLGGYVPDEQTRDRLVAAATRLFHVPVRDDMQLADGVPFDGWAEAAIIELEALSQLNHGTVSANGNAFRLDGATDEASIKQEIETRLRRFPAGGMSIISVQGPDIDIRLSPEEVATIDRCQRQFDALLGQENIVFSPSSAVISERSWGLLDRLAQAARSCPTVQIEISAHTDNRQSAALDLKLSQARAEAVRAYLMAKNVPAERLVAKGYGQSKPIGDNETATGRALNRRIEFKVSAP